MGENAIDEAEDQAAILDLLHRTRIAIWTHNFAAYQACFVHAEYVTRWQASPSVGMFRREDGTT